MNPEEESASMKRQMSALGELLSSLPVSIMIYDGIEADDVMAYIATKCYSPQNHLLTTGLALQHG